MVEAIELFREGRGGLERGEIVDRRRKSHFFTEKYINRGS